MIKIINRSTSSDLFDDYPPGFATRLAIVRAPQNSYFRRVVMASLHAMGAHVVRVHRPNDRVFYVVCMAKAFDSVPAGKRLPIYELEVDDVFVGEEHPGEGEEHSGERADHHVTKIIYSLELHGHCAWARATGMTDNPVRFVDMPMDAEPVELCGPVTEEVQKPEPEEEHPPVLMTKEEHDERRMEALLLAIRTSRDLDPDLFDELSGLCEDKAYRLRVEKHEEWERSRDLDSSIVPTRGFDDGGDY